VLGQVAPMLARGGNQRQEMDLGEHFAVRCDQLQGIPQGSLGRVGSAVVDPAVGRDVAQRHRGRHAMGMHDRLQQRGVERLHFGAVGGRALGKDRDAVALLQRVVHGVVDARGIVAPRALQEQRSLPGDQPADHGPAPDLRLRDETRRHGAGDDEDVEPGNVIRQQHGRTVAFDRRIAVHADAHREDLEQGTGPAAEDLEPAIAADERKHQRRGREAGQQVEEHPSDAIGPGECAIGHAS